MAMVLRDDHERPDPRGMNRARLVALAEFLLDLPRPLFDFSHFVRVPECGRQPDEALRVGGGCGTSACAVGWLPAVFPRLAQWETNVFGKTETVVLRPTPRHERLVLAHNVTRTRNLHAARIVFNLTEREAEWLFLPCDHDEGHCLDLAMGVVAGKCKRPGSHANNWQVARHILAMVEGGPPKEFETWRKVIGEWEAGQW